MKVLKIYGKGKREQNQDAYFIDENQSLFIVCDGVGGGRNGEVASQFIADHLGAAKIKDAESLNEAIAKAQSALNDKLTQHADLEGMATTLCLLKKIEDYYLLAHIGDSRIYQFTFSEGKYHLWRTTDHSLIEEMIQDGTLSRDEAEDAEVKNVISKAIVANKDGKITEPDIQAIHPESEKDIFLICSDGLTEAFNDENLLHLINAHNGDLKTIQQKIKEACEKKSNDNFTVLLIQDGIVSQSSGKGHQIDVKTQPDKKNDLQQSKKPYLLIALILLPLLLMIFFFTQKENPSESPSYTSSEFDQYWTKNDLRFEKNEDGEILIYADGKKLPKSYFEVIPISEDFAMARDENGWNALNKKGQNFVFGTYDWIDYGAVGNDTVILFTKGDNYIFHDLDEQRIGSIFKKISETEYEIKLIDDKGKERTFKKI